MIVGICLGSIVLFWVYLLWRMPRIDSPLTPIDIKESVSIIIAFRNEEDEFPNILKALDAQKGVCKEHIQCIFIDDYSEDKSGEIINHWKKLTKYEVSLVALEKGTGKKAALKYGSSLAKYNKLLFIDADCIPNTYWINQMVCKYNSKQTDLLVGTVWYAKSSLFFLRLQQLEFSVLQSITACSVQAKWPFMCNGANLMTNKNTYKAYLESETTQHMVSGDDVFYLDYLVRNKKKIAYANSVYAIVETRGEERLKQFIQQRIRWSAKIKYYKNIKMILPSLFFTCWSLSILVPTLFFFWLPLWICILGVALKIGIDYIIVRKFYRSFKRTFLLIDFLTLTATYPIYVICIGVLSFFKTFTWKNRHAKA